MNVTYVSTSTFECRYALEDAGFVGTAETLSVGNLSRIE
jgi:hypothetical protein